MFTHPQLLNYKNPILRIRAALAGTLGLQLTHMPTDQDSNDA